MEPVVQEQPKGQGNAPISRQSGIKSGLYILVAPEDTLDGRSRAVKELEGYGKGQEVHDGIHQIQIRRIEPGNQPSAQEQTAAEESPDQDVRQPSRICIGLGLNKIPGSHIGSYDDGQ